MKFDIFFSICQTEVDGYMPAEKVMFENFLDQVKHADKLGFGTAWVAETHLSCQVQKQNPNPVIPHFKGEIGLNTEILQLAHVVFHNTDQINIGSAIRNILCNGGPIAHAENIRMYLALHDLLPYRNRTLDIGFASGRFPFSTNPYGIRPRNSLEETIWSPLKGKIFAEATEIFLRFLKGEVFSSKEVRKKSISKNDFRSDTDWQKVEAIYKEQYGSSAPEEIYIEPTWHFDKVGVIPFESPMGKLRLTIGSHDPKVQHLANEFMPVGVFNLSITPVGEIEETHQRMLKHYHRDGGPWKRAYMPRTVLVFLDADKGGAEERNRRAKEQGEKALSNYWKAVEGTLDPKKVQNAVNNALTGDPESVAKQITERFHEDDRLMLWFDFNNHDNESVKKSMSLFMEKVVPLLDNKNKKIWN